jgi:hypothetical protein
MFPLPPFALGQILLLLLMQILLLMLPVLLMMPLMLSLGKRVGVDSGVSRITLPRPSRRRDMTMRTILGRLLDILVVCEWVREGLHKGIHFSLDTKAFVWWLLWLG